VINLVVALACEAKPLIQAYSLKKSSTMAVFPLYVSADMLLIVSGVGKINAAAATAVLATFAANLPTQGLIAWLNIGVAGHRNRAIGDEFLALKLVDGETKNAYYPTWLEKLPCQTDNLLTVSKAIDNLPDDYAVDMEASGFYPIALKYSCVELVHIYKVISDNAKDDYRNISAASVKNLINERLNTIKKVVSQLVLVCNSMNRASEIPESYQQLAKQYHLTATQQAQLKRSLLQWNALSKDCIISALGTAKLKDARQLLTAINKLLANLEIKY